MQKAELKKQVDSLLDELPEDTNWDELMYKIYVRQSIEEGIGPAGTDGSDNPVNQT